MAFALARLGAQALTLDVATPGRFADLLNDGV
jgi:hypothetical protein